MRTINGIGTKLYGTPGYFNDGSYIATKWFVILYFPVIPLGTYRVWSEKEFVNLAGNTIMMTNKDNIKSTLFQTEQSFKMQRVKLNLKQIGFTYLIGIIIFTMLLILVWLLSKIL